jgi:hypothetical protein
MEYIAFSIETTSIGVIRLQISVKVTTSENNIETLSNIYAAEERDKWNEASIYHRLTLAHGLFCVIHLTGVNGILAPAEPIRHLFWDHLVQQLISSPHFLVQFPHRFFQLLWLLLFLVERQFQFYRLLRSGEQNVPKWREIKISTTCGVLIMWRSERGWEAVAFFRAFF